VKKAIRRIAAVALLVGSFVLAWVVIHFQPHIEHALRSLGFSKYPLAIVVFALVASAPFSVTDALAIMNGAIFGPWWGSLVNAIGLVFAAMLGYEINRRASHLMDLEATLKRLPPWVKRFPVGSPMFLISVRIIPGLGGTVATATAATFKVPMWVHVWTMCAIAVPLCTILAIFGNRVTVFVHNQEHRVKHYCEQHRCPHVNIHWRLRRSERTDSRPYPQVTPIQ
jgi:uncharacterized membrane protein YdjX (TVP38/TMEM64 family)